MAGNEIPEIVSSNLSSLSIDNITISENDLDDGTLNKPEISSQKLDSSMEVDDFFLVVKRLQSIQKKELQAPKTKAAYLWREEMDKELTKSLNLVEPLMTNKVLKNRKLVEGPNETAAASRLARVAALLTALLKPQTNMAQKNLFKPPQMEQLRGLLVAATVEVQAPSKSLSTQQSFAAPETVALLEQICEDRFTSLVATTERISQIEQVRQEVYARLCTHHKFKKEFQNGGGVEIFGSSVAALASPNSDVDLCLRLPRVGKDLVAKRNILEIVKAERIALESSCAVMDEVRALTILQKDKFPNAETRVRSRQSKVRVRSAQMAEVEKGIEREVSKLMKQDEVREEDARKKVELKFARKLKAEKIALKDATRNLEIGERELEALRLKRNKLQKSAIAHCPDFTSFMSQLTKLQTHEKRATADVVEAGKIVFAVSQTLHSASGFKSLPKRAFQVVGRARVPVVKVTEQALGVAFDVVVNNEIALRNSLLVASYALEPRARRIIFLVKAWAKAKKLNEAPNGTPSSYCHALLVVFFLMQTPHDIAAMMGQSQPSSSVCRPVLPNLQQCPGLDSVLVDGFETKFEVDLSKAQRLDGRPTDTRSVPELLVAYFHWLSWLLRNPHHCCVSVCQGKLLPDKALLWNNGKRWRLSVEDPFETISSPKPHDLGQVVTREGQRRLQVACENIASSLALSLNLSAKDISVGEKAKLQGWVNFLGLKPANVETSTHKSLKPEAGAKPILDRLGPPVVRDPNLDKAVSNASVKVNTTAKFATIDVASLCVDHTSPQKPGSEKVEQRLKQQVKKEPLVTARSGGGWGGGGGGQQPKVEYSYIVSGLEQLIHSEVGKCANQEGNVVTLSVSALKATFEKQSGSKLTNDLLRKSVGSRKRFSTVNKLLGSLSGMMSKRNGMEVVVRFDEVSSGKPITQKPPAAKVYVPEVAAEASSTWSRQELCALLERLLNDGKWTTVAALKAKFFKATNIRLRPVLFSGQPKQLEAVLTSIPSLQHSGDHHANCKPRWRYMGPVAQNTAVTDPIGPQSTQKPNTHTSEHSA